MLELSGIALSMQSVERLLQPRKPRLQLYSLVLQRASLNASLTPALLQVPSLRELDLSFSDVQGPLPPQRHCSLQHLNLAGNWQLTGALPQGLLLNPNNTAALEQQALAERGTTFCDVLHLNLSSTGISGQLPELPDNTASSLATLDLSNTRVCACMPCCVAPPADCSCTMLGPICLRTLHCCWSLRVVAALIVSPCNPAYAAVQLALQRTLSALP
jgi:hypothetical protein